MAIQTLLESQYRDYEQLLEVSQVSTVFQTITYLESLKQLRYDFEILGYYENQELIYAMPVQKKKIPFIKRYFYAIPYGIITNQTRIPNEVIDTFISYLKQKGWIIRLNLQNEFTLNQFTQGTHQTTLLIDLSQPMESLFTDFSKTHRNCVRKAEKEGVIVEINQNLDFLDRFIDLYKTMLEEKAFDGLNPTIVRNILVKLIHSKLGFFAIASYGGQVQNIAFITTIGDKARYLYGASLKHQPNTPPIGQYLHYEIIQYLRMEKYQSYDLGGIPNLPVDENHPAYPVYKFKKGFGGVPTILSYEYQFYKFSFLKKLIR